MTVSLHNRRKLEDAIARLLDGTATPADGKLTWKNVAAVAGVSKATADRAVDLRDEFRRQTKRNTSAPPVRVESTKRSQTHVEEELSRLRKENAELKRSTAVLHATVLALLSETEQFSRIRSGRLGDRQPQQP